MYLAVKGLGSALSTAKLHSPGVVTQGTCDPTNLGG